jgi:hypothetical protein
LAFTTTSSAAGGENYGLYFGTKIDFTAIPCAYQQNLILTVTARI